CSPPPCFLRSLGVKSSFSALDFCPIFNQTDVSWFKDVPKTTTEGNGDNEERANKAPPGLNPSFPSFPCVKSFSYGIVIRAAADPSRQITISAGPGIVGCHYFIVLFPQLSARLDALFQ